MNGFTTIDGGFQLDLEHTKSDPVGLEGGFTIQNPVQEGKDNNSGTGQRRLGNLDLLGEGVSSDTNYQVRLGTSRRVMDSFDRKNIEVESETLSRHLFSLPLSPARHNFSNIREVENFATFLRNSRHLALGDEDMALLNSTLSSFNNLRPDGFDEKSFFHQFSALSMIERLLKSWESDETGASTPFHYHCILHMRKFFATLIEKYQGGAFIDEKWVSIDLLDRFHLRLFLILGLYREKEQIRIANTVRIRRGGQKAEYDSFMEKFNEFSNSLLNSRSTVKDPDQSKTDYFLSFARKFAKLLDQFMKLELSPNSIGSVI